MEEEWRDIEGYEGYYQVSNLGRVRSLDRFVAAKNGGKRFVKGHFLSLNLDKRGYLRVVLSKNSKHISPPVHRLVAQAFISNDNNLPQVNHKNEIKTDNRVENLEWCDSKYNNNYGTRNERMAKTKGKPVVQLTVEGDFVARYDSAMDAARALNIGNITGIRSALTEEQYTAYDYCWWYEWEYENIYGKGSIG